MDGTPMACATGTANIDTAAKAVRRNETRMAITGIVEFGGIEEFGQAFSEAGAIAKAGDYHGPLDRDATGLVPAEAAYAYILEPSDELQEDSRVYGYVLSGAKRFDTDIMVAPNEQIKAIRDTINPLKKLIENGTINKDNLVVLPHFTATPHGDKADVACLQQAVNEGLIPRDAYLVALKSILGHSWGASGYDSLAAAILMMDQGVVYANYGITHPRISESELGLRFLRDGPELADIKYALIGSVGMSGSVSWLLVSKDPLEQD